MHMALPPHSVVVVDYTLFADDKFVETTIKENDQVKATETAPTPKTYEPFIFIQGGGQILPALEEAVQACTPGVPASVTMAPDRAYGVRRLELLKWMPNQQFGATKPKIGMQVKLDNRIGFVTKIAGGRVLVDYNHELAGKHLRFDYTVRAVHSDLHVKVNVLVERMVGKDVRPMWADEDSLVDIDVPDEVHLRSDWQKRRVNLVRVLRQAMGEHEPMIRFMESYLPPPQKPVPTPMPDPLLPTV